MVTVMMVMMIEQEDPLEVFADHFVMTDGHAVTNTVMALRMEVQSNGGGDRNHFSQGMIASLPCQRQISVF